MHIHGVVLFLLLRPDSEKDGSGRAGGEVGSLLRDTFRYLTRSKLRDDCVDIRTIKKISQHITRLEKLRFFVKRSVASSSINILFSSTTCFAKSFPPNKTR